VKKTVIVAGAELGMLIRTKAFIVTILLMPVLMFGSVLVQRVVAKQVDQTPRRFAVIDGSGEVWEPLRQRLELRNAVLRGQAPFYPERVEVTGDLDMARLVQSERVRKGEIFAFVEIPRDALDARQQGRLRYHSDQPTYDDLRLWLDAQMLDLRLRAAGIDPELLMRFQQPGGMSENLGLYTRGENGALREAPRVDPVRTYAVPLGLMYIMFFAIFLSAPQLMNATIQEKMSRISEVLLGSVTSVELMLGKLLGGAGAALVLAIVYLTGAVVVAAHWGYGDLLTPALVVYFLIFMALAVLLFGAVFVAVGAACSDLKDAQSLITPVMLVVVLPMFAAQAVLKSPGSAFSVAASLFPPATPFLMLMRLAIHPGPPWWQVGLAIVLTAIMTYACVWAAAKVFRVGILATGKSAGLGQMLRWMRAR
jgi:ABC-2 type transport system permease protein